ncbi:11502_t:CDS:2 [Cetraspora pellucida]|uniref:11502_t:CDS:1 n=1 Tax=Cetraspora pellucida TaxID=1433469 RepID=A0ACA9KI40_9GLOM|nr:11502_t:CDS:2 [Cetraspora pellucida]
MAFNRRGCFKCGNVRADDEKRKVSDDCDHRCDSSSSTLLIGHFADSCPEPERLCYNCKQPGHEANQCPQPRTADAKQCYSCGGADCPSVRVNGSGSAGGRCYNCGRFGHLARNCSTNNYHGGNRGHGHRGYGGGRVICYKCGGFNHFARDCQANGVKCYNCGRFGHISRDCPSSQGSGDKSVKTCYRCSERGHIKDPLIGLGHKGLAGSNYLMNRNSLIPPNSFEI